MPDDRHLRTEFEGDSSDLERAFDKAADAAESSSNRQEKAAKKATDAVTKWSAGITLGMGAALGLATKVGMDFEHGLSAVGAVAGATADELDGLRAVAIQLGADTQYSSGQVASAMESLAANGLTATDIMQGAAKAATDLAAAGGTDLTMAADTVSTAMAVWGLKTDDMADAVNRLAGAANVSRFGVEDMSLAIAQGGGAAAAAGVEFADFTTAVAGIASYFSSGADAGTSLKVMLTRLTPQSKEAASTMKELGIVTEDGANKFFDAQGNLKGMADIVDVLHKATAGLSEQQRIQALQTMFGTDAMRAAAGMAKMTGDEFKTLSDKMGNTSAAEVAAQRMNNLSGDVEQLKGSLESAGIVIAQKFMPALRSGAQVATEAVNGFASLDSGSQGLILAVVGITAAMPAAIAGIEKLGNGIKNLGQFAQTGKGQLTGIALGIGAISIAADAILQKTTGHGLVEWLFGDPRLADHVTDVMARFEARLQTLGPDANRAQEAVNGIADSFEKWYVAQEKLMAEGGPKQMFGELQTAKEFKGEIEALAQTMMKSGATFAQYKAVHDQLTGTFQESFDKLVKYDERVKTYSVTVEQSGFKAEAARFAQMNLNNAIADAVEPPKKAMTAIEAYSASLGEGKERADALKSSIDGLTNAFADSNPTVLELNASTAFMKRELEELKSKGDALTEAERARVKVLEDGIKRNDELTESYKRNKDALKGAQSYMESMMGSVGYGGLLKAMADARVEQDRQVEVMGQLSSAFQHATANDIPGMLAILSQLKTELANQPGAWAAVMEAVGPTMREAIERGGPEAVAAARGVGGDIATGIVEGLNSYATFLYAQAREMARRTVNEMHNGIQAGSPSRLSRDEVGIPIGQGVALGLTESEPLVQDAARQLAAEAVGSAGATVSDVMNHVIGQAQQTAAAAWSAFTAEQMKQMPLGGYDGHATVGSDGSVTLTGTRPNPADGIMANFDVGMYSPVPLTAGERMALGEEAYKNYVNGNGVTAIVRPANTWEDAVAQAKANGGGIDPITGRWTGYNLTPKATVPGLSSSGSGPVTINLTLDGRVLTQVVVDNLDDARRLQQVTL